MFRKLILLGAFVGACASFPVIYQNNPEAFEDAARSVLQRPQAGPAELSVLHETSAQRPASGHGRSVRLAADARGHFTADFRFNGRNVDAMIDTGATVVAINRSTARRIGISLAESDFAHEVMTANGRTRAAGVMIDSLEIGRIRLDGVQAVVLEDEALHGTLVGMSFLGRLRRFGVEGGQLHLEQ